MIVRDIIQQLVEAKSFINHMPNSLYRHLSEVVYVFKDPFLFTTKGEVSTVESLVSYVENKFRESGRNNILIKYVHWFMKALTVRSNDDDYQPPAILSNLDDIVDTILVYHKARQSGKDIPSLDEINGIEEMEEVVDRVDTEERLFKTKQAILLYEDSKARIIRILSFEASRFFAGGKRHRNIPWCISSNKSDWNGYKEDGYNWIFILTKDRSGKKYAVDPIIGFVWNEINKREDDNLWKIRNEYPYLNKIAPTTLKEIRDEIVDAISAEFSREVFVGTFKSDDIEGLYPEDDDHNIGYVRVEKSGKSFAYIFTTVNVTNLRYDANHEDAEDIDSFEEIIRDAFDGAANRVKSTIYTFDLRRNKAAATFKRQIQINL